MLAKLDIQTELKKLSDENYRIFSSSLLPNINNILGVRLPTLRKMAKEIYKSQDYKEFLSNKNPKYMEETMLQAMIIGLVDNPISEIKKFIPKIDNWSVCDCFCAGLKYTKKNKKEVWTLIKPYFKSKKEFELRFAYVMLLNYFIDEEYIDKVLNLIDKFKDDRYYSKMAVAWLVSICYVKQKEKTIEYLKKSKLSDWTFNKSIQKICESLRVEKSEKEFLKTLKR